MNVFETNYLEKCQNDPKIFFEELYRLYIDDKRNQANKVNDIIIELNQKHNINICDKAIEAVNQGASVFDVVNILKTPFPFLKHNLISLLQFIKSIYYLMKNDGSSFEQHELIRNLAKEQPVIVKELLKELLITKDEFIVGYIACIYEVFSVNKIEETHKELISQVKNENIFLVQGIITALSIINYVENNKTELIEQTLDVYSELILKNSIQINNTIIICLKPFIGKFEKAEKLLVELSKSNEVETLYFISRLLFLVSKLSNKPWYLEILKKFNNTVCENFGIIQNIDYILSRMIYEKNSANVPEIFLKDWFIRSDFKKHSTEIEKIWPSTLNTLQNDDISLSYLLTTLFDDDNYVCHIAAGEIISYLNVQNKNNIILDSNILSGLSFNSILFICQKILGYLFQLETIYSLLNSIVLLYKEDQKVVYLITDIYLNYLSKDYLSTTIKLIEETNNNLEKCLLKDKLENLILQLTERRELINSLPRLKELNFSKRKQYQINLEESKIMNMVMNNGKSCSLINLLKVKTIPLKYSKAWFSFIDGEYSDKSKLSTFSHFVEIPRSEITQPVSSAIIKFQFRLEKRIVE